MTSEHQHAYHLPSERELAQTRLIIGHRQDQIMLIDLSIERERANLDARINQLETTYAPSIAEIRERIEREEAKMALLERQRTAEECALRETTAQKIANWEQRRADLDKEIENDKGFIAPIRRLPFELLSEIFVQFGAGNNPWPLTKVCRSWRTVALRSPRLWAQIFITDTRIPVETSYRRAYKHPRSDNSLKTAPSEEEDREYAQRCMTVKGLETALNLTRGAPLYVVISIGDLWQYSGYYDNYTGAYDDIDVGNQSIEILQLLTLHFPRIQSLIIRRLPDLRNLSEFENRFASVFKEKLPLLVELEVNMCNALTEALMASVQEKSRNLKSLTYTQPSPAEGWGLEINVRLKRALLSNLTSLRLGKGKQPFENALWESMIQLQEVEFAGWDLHNWSALLLPNLRRLTISGGTATDLGGHLPRLKYLALYSVTLDADAFSISAPALEVLVVSNRLECARTLEAPNLESLTIHSKSLKKTDANTLVAMLWKNTGTAKGRYLNPRKLRVEVNANDTALAKVVKLMDRIEDLQVDLHAKTNYRKKLLADFALKGKRGANADLPVLCPNLKRLRVFPGKWVHREVPVFRPGDKLQIQNLLNGISAARPGVECVFEM
jgi:Leucine-rich repeat (LRR) protein